MTDTETKPTRNERLTAIGGSVKRRLEERTQRSARSSEQADLDYLYERLMRTIAVLIQEDDNHE